MQAACLVFVALDEYVGLQPGQVLQGGRIAVNQHEIHKIQNRQVERAQILGHMGPPVGLGHITVGGHADQQLASLRLGPEQMADMAWMDQIKSAMAHDKLFGPGPGPRGLADLCHRHDFYGHIAQA